MNNLFKDKGNIKVWGAIAVVIIAGSGAAYFLFSRTSLPQENLSAAVSVPAATETPAVIAEKPPLPDRPISAKPVPVPGVPAVSVQPAVINWIGTWQGPMKITAPLDCASKTGQDADITFYINSVADNNISGRITAFGLGADRTESIISEGSVNDNKFSFTTNGITKDFVMSGNISGDILSLKSISAFDCGAITTEKPVKLFRVK